MTMLFNKVVHHDVELLQVFDIRRMLGFTNSQCFHSGKDPMASSGISKLGVEGVISSSGTLLEYSPCVICSLNTI